MWKNCRMMHIGLAFKNNGKTDDLWCSSIIVVVTMSKSKRSSASPWGKVVLPIDTAARTLCHFWTDIYFIKCKLLNQKWIRWRGISCPYSHQPWIYAWKVVQSSFIFIWERKLRIALDRGSTRTNDSSVFVIQNRSRILQQTKWNKGQSQKSWNQCANIQNVMMYPRLNGVKSIIKCNLNLSTLSRW